MHSSSTCTWGRYEYACKMEKGRGVTFTLTDISDCLINNYLNDYYFPETVLGNDLFSWFSHETVLL